MGVAPAAWINLLGRWLVHDKFLRTLFNHRWRSLGFLAEEQREEVHRDYTGARVMSNCAVRPAMVAFSATASCGMSS